MKTLPWSRDEVIQTLREDIWLYITQDSLQHKGTDGILLEAGALLQMPVPQVRFFAQLHFVLSEAVASLLDQMPTLIRKLTPTTESAREISAQRVRGTIQWSETYAHRASTGTPHLFVTAPTQRAFDTPENQVLVFALQAIADFGSRSGWFRGSHPGPASEVRRRVHESTRWLKARPFADVSTRPPTATTLSRVRTGRARLRYATALEVVELYQKYIARLDRTAVKDAIERHALLASRSSVLLELHCAFDVIRTLRNLGWQAPPQGWLKSPRIFLGVRDGQSIEVFYQHTPPELSTGSRYAEVQKAHHFAVGAPRPDLVIKLESGATVRWLLIEVKLSEKAAVQHSARAAIRDLFSYRRAFSKVLDLQGKPYALGYTWGQGLEPSVEGDVTLCTPDTLPVALELLEFG